MPDNFFKGIFESDLSRSISINEFLSCLGASLILGIILAVLFAIKSRSTKGFVSTLALLPAIVCVVIMMVNGNIGAGVAVAGAFSLVRFRSAPGSAREIAAIFLAMSAGLACGMGYLGFAFLFVAIVGVLFTAYNYVDYLLSKRATARKTLKITIPEDLDYTDVFEDLFKEYTKDCVLVRVKTANMGSLFKLTYDLTLREPKKEKEFVDRLRERNGNLEIMISREEPRVGEL